MTGTALVLIVGAESAVLIGGSRLVGLPGLLLVLVASAAWAFVASDERVDRRPLLVAGAIGVVFAIAIAVPPHGSLDLWSYVMDGRILGVHHTNPYVHPPSDFRHDIFFSRVGTGWRHTRSVYGPLFTGVSALLTRATGSSALRTRLAFQGLSTIGVIAALILIWRETRSARSVAFCGLHPAVVTAIVNGGHNDSLVGLAVLAGALLASRRRWCGAGFVLGLGMVVKASTALGLLGIAAWSLYRCRRGALKLMLVAAATTLVAYIPAGLVAVRAATHAGNGTTRASVWNPIRHAPHPSLAIALVAVLILAAVAAYLRRDRPRPSSTALASTAAYLIGGAYVLPSYSAWALPAAALDRRSRLAWLVAAQAAFLVALYEFELPGHTTLTGAPAGVRTALLQMGSWSALAAFLVILFGARGRNVRTGDPSE